MGHIARDTRTLTNSTCLGSLGEQVGNWDSIPEDDLDIILRELDEQMEKEAQMDKEAHPSKMEVEAEPNPLGAKLDKEAKPDPVEDLTRQMGELILPSRAGKRDSVSMMQEKCEYVQV